MREYGADHPWSGWVTVDPLDDGSRRVRITVWNRGLGHTDPSVCKSAVLDAPTAMDLAVEIAYTSEGGDHDDSQPRVDVDQAGEDQGQEEA